jgi:hypothetical protein
MSRRSFPHRLMTTFAVVLSLLFSQLALANYVCPTRADAAAMADAMVAGEPCTGMDEVQPVLCHQYGANATQSFEMAKVATPTPPAIVQVLVVPVLLDTADAVALPFGATPQARPPPDPVFLATLRLRV